jgi:hypothetical protein
MMTPDILWSELETEAQRMIGTGILKRMLAPEAACTMFLGVQRPSLNRLFLLQIPRTMLPSREQMPESRGFDLTVQITGEEAETHATFVLNATDRMFNEVFSAMVENLYQSLQECHEERKIVRIFLERLAQWQEFFERIGVNGLSEEAQRGLYGELHFLKKHLLSTPEYFATEMSGWTGPKNRQHDFQFGDAVVEVKTCSAKQHQKLLISSEQQLDETLVGSLFVFHLSLSPVEDHADTLPALVTGLREVVHSVYAAASTFEAALLERGYLDAQAWRYQKTGYVVRESNIFRVTGDFPRLTERDLPLGVGDLTYSISVTECKKFSVPLEEVIAHIRRGRV